MNSVPSIQDRELLAALARQPGAVSVRPVLERFLPLVYASALRRTGDEQKAAEATRAVFLVLARRARKLRKNILLAGWLFQVTAIACRKVGLKEKRSRWNWFVRDRRPELPPCVSPWMQIAPAVDQALDRLSPKWRIAVLSEVLFRRDGNATSGYLGISEARAQKWIQGGWREIAKKLRKSGLPTGDSIAGLFEAALCASILPENLAPEIEAAIDQNGRKRPALKLARRTLNVLAWRRWRQRVVIGVPTFLILISALGALAWHIDGKTGHSRLLSAVIIWSVKHEGRTVPGLAQPAKPWPPVAQFGAQPQAASVRSARDIYQMTNIWSVNLTFSNDQWKALEPKRIGALPNFFQPNGTVLLRNPKAQRSGLAGVLGFDFNWTHADFELGGVKFTNVAARYKGNGTYLTSLYGSKRAFKVDLNHYTKGQKLAGLDEFTFNNLIDDRSYMSDALAYEFFRDAGVPAPRTAYAYLNVTVRGKFERKPLGLYAMVEPMDGAFAAEHFRSKSAPVFKPVTYKLFEHIGDDWSAYAPTYDLKTKATEKQKQRVIELARLVSNANDEEFAARVEDFLDFDAFARFLAGEVLLSSYDSFLANGQNYYLYLDPRSNKFGFIPWDMDLAWGGFFLLGTTKERERASIWHPWVGDHRFLERVMGVEKFRQAYRAHLEDFLTRLFVPERLHRRIDEMAEVIQEPIAAESTFRLEKFEQAISDKKSEFVAKRGNPNGANRPVHQLKNFIVNRAQSVRQQLDGKSDGVILHHSRRE
jgi:DNA-directed RNA polymerase specialized sigma24 family protein